MKENEAIECLKCYRAQSGTSFPEEIEMAPVHPHAERSRTHLVKVYGCEGGAVAGDYRNRSNKRRMRIRCGVCVRKHGKRTF